MGLIGVVIILIMFLAKLSSISCLNVDYLTPFSPLNIQDIKNSFIKFSIKKLKYRPSYLTNNTKRMSDINEKNDN